MLTAPNISSVPVALLAGGLATRLGPLSARTPKALIDVNGRAFIDHQVTLLQRKGISHIVFCLGHLGEKIEEHLGDGSSVGMQFQYSYDGNELAGTGGAVRKALPMLGDMFWVMYGDSYMDIDYADVLDHFSATRRARPPAGVMTVIHNQDRWDASNAVFKDGRLTCYDKRNHSDHMEYIDYGVQILRREAFDTAPAGPFDLSDLYRDMVARREMIGYEVFNRFYEIGTPQSLEETRKHLHAPAWSL